MNENERGLVREWYKVQQELGEIKKRESELRKEVQNVVFSDQMTDTGTHEQTLTDDVKLVLTVPKKVSIDKELFDRHKDSMNLRGLIGDDTLVKLEPKVSVTALKHLSPEDKAAFGDIFVVSTGSPSMKVVTKK